MTFSVFPNLRCPGVTKHGQNSESADQDWPDVRVFFHFHIPFTHRLRHLSLAHILTDDRIACIDRLFDLSENLFKIGITSAKSSCSKQKNLLFLISTAILMSFGLHSLCPSKIRYSIRRIAVPANRLCQNNRICPLATFHRLHQPASLYYPLSCKTGSNNVLLS